jgi:hypothetical protein
MEDFVARSVVDEEIAGGRISEFYLLMNINTRWPNHLDGDARKERSSECV